MRPLLLLLSLLCVGPAVAQHEAWEDGLAPRGGKQLDVGGVEFRSIESVTAKSPKLTIVGRALVSTFCSKGRCPNETKAYERVTLVFDTNTRGFRGGAVKPGKADWGRHFMGEGLRDCARLAQEAQGFRGDYFQVAFINAHDYETKVFRHTDDEAHVEYARVYDANRGDGMQCSVSFIDAGKADPNEMAWPPRPAKLPERPGDRAPARFTAAFIPTAVPAPFQEDMTLFLEELVKAIQGPGAYAIKPQPAGRGPVSKAAALKLGRQAGVEQVLVTRLFFQNGGGWTASLECYDVASGRQVASGKGRCPGCVPGGGLPDMVAHDIANAVRKKLKMPRWVKPPQ